jgi:hypothetical protein
VCGKFKLDTTHVHTNVSRTISFAVAVLAARLVVRGVGGKPDLANPNAAEKWVLLPRETQDFWGHPRLSKKLLKPSSAVYDLSERSEALEILGS